MPVLDKGELAVREPVVIGGNVEVAGLGAANGAVIAAVLHRHTSQLAPSVVQRDHGKIAVELRGRAPKPLPKDDLPVIAAFRIRRVRGDGGAISYPAAEVSLAMPASSSVYSDGTFMEETHFTVNSRSVRCSHHLTTSMHGHKPWHAAI